MKSGYIKEKEKYINLSWQKALLANCEFFNTWFKFSQQLYTHTHISRIINYGNLENKPQLIWMDQTT